MNCFNHQDKPAVALCKSCGKALCGDCLAELSNGIACKGSCEDRVNLINRIINRNSQILTAARHQIRHSGLFMLLAGIGFLAFAVFGYIQFPDTFIPYFLGFMGVLIFVGGISRLSRKEQYPRSDQEKS